MMDLGLGAQKLMSRLLLACLLACLLLVCLLGFVQLP